MLLSYACVDIFARIDVVRRGPPGSLLCGKVADGVVPALLEGASRVADAISPVLPALLEGSFKGGTLVAIDGALHPVHFLKLS